MLHITVATAPEARISSSDPIHVLRDSTALKAALLYADKVMLCSFGAAFASLLTSLRTFKWKDQLKILEVLFSETENDPAQRSRFDEYLKKYKELKRKPHLGGKELAYVTKYETLFGAKLDAMEAEGERIAANYSDLHLRVERCIREGLLEVYAFKRMTGSLELAQEFGSLLDNILVNPETYPLLDPFASRLALPELVTPSAIAKNRHVSLAAKLLERLPQFDAAEFDEICDIRRELAKPLIRFRAAILNLSERIRSKGWDPDFFQETEVVFIKDVGPAVLEIEELVKANKYLVTVLERSLTIRGTLPSVVLLALSASLGTSQILAGTTAASILGLDALNAYKQKQEEIKQHQFFFYYAAGKKLAS